MPGHLIFSRVGVCTTFFTAGEYEATDGRFWVRMNRLKFNEKKMKQIKLK